MAKISISKYRKIVKHFNILDHLDNSIIVKILAPSSKSNNYARDEKYLNRADFGQNVERKVERFYTYKLIVMIISLAVLLLLNSYYISMKNNEIIYSNTYTSTVPNNNLFNFNLKSNSNGTANNSTQYYEKTLLLSVINDKNINFNQLIDDGKLQQLGKLIKLKEDDIGINDDDNNTIAKNVLSDLLDISMNKTSVITILFIIAAAIFSVKLLDLYLWLKSKFRDAKIENEVIKLEYHAVILIKGSKISVENILKRIRDYSHYLLPYFNTCLAEYSSDQYLAIEHLIDRVDNVYFTKFMTLIQQNLATDPETNIKLLESQKNVNFVLNEEKKRGKYLKTSLIYTNMSIPFYMLIAFDVVFPLLKYISSLF